VSNCVVAFLTIGHGMVLYYLLLLVMDAIDDVVVVDVDVVVCGRENLEYHCSMVTTLTVP